MLGINSSSVMDTTSVAERTSRRENGGASCPRWGLDHVDCVSDLLKTTRRSVLPKIYFVKSSPLNASERQDRGMNLLNHDNRAEVADQDVARHVGRLKARGRDSP
jgi:hypothetical protein